MFKNLTSSLKSYFSKNKTNNPDKEDGENREEADVVAGVVYYIDHSGEIFLDFRMDEVDEESAKHLAKLLSSMFSQTFQMQTMAILKRQLDSHGASDLFLEIASNVILNVGVEQFEKVGKDDPCISPTDMI